MERKGVMKKSYVNLILYIAGIVIVLWFCYEVLGVNIPYIVPALVEWATLFILPWIVLYWFIRFVKSMEKK
jgi:hypothetical protein